MGAVPPPPHDPRKSLEENLRELRAWSARRARFRVFGFAVMACSVFLLLLVVSVAIVKEYG